MKYHYSEFVIPLGNVEKFLNDLEYHASGTYRITKISDPFMADSDRLMAHIVIRFRIEEQGWPIFDEKEIKRKLGL